MADDGETALVLINNHMQQCAQATLEMKDAIKELRNWIVAMIGFTMVTVTAAFAYEYQKNDTLAAEHQETSNELAKVGAAVGIPPSEMKAK